MAPFLTVRRRGFTLIELLVATTIITLVAVSATVNLNKVRANSRDGRRKSDVQAISQALSAYQLAKNTDFVIIQGSSQGCNPSSNNFDLQATDNGCVGANGRSYGFSNLVNATTAPVTYTNVVPNITDPGRVYSATSIDEALNQAGFLNTISTDPLNKLTGTHTTDPSKPDYVIVRCCKDGRESVNKTGSVFAVWASLEGTPSTTDQSNTDLTCGGSKTASNVDAKYLSTNHSYGSKYTYDFGNGTATRPNYAVGTSIGTSSVLCPTEENSDIAS
jgi:prepilin-type N-terminal cleavage/methylation domain-containing protein